MRPVLFNIPFPYFGAVPVRAYGFFVMLGCLAGIIVILRKARREHADPNHLWDIWMWSLIGGFAGARAFYVYLYWPQFAGNLRSVFYIWEGGLAFQGGLVGALICVYTYLKVKRLAVGKYLDMIAAGVILGYAFARVGCFLNGCCHGEVTDAAWAVTYPAAAPVDAKGTLRLSPAYETQIEGSGRLIPERMADSPGCKGRVKNGRLIDTYAAWLAGGGQGEMPRSCPVHPTQLYASGAALIIFFILSVYYDRPRHVGQVIALFGVLYTCYRFANEFFRGDSPLHGGLTIYQILCIGLFIAFGWAWLYCQNHMPTYLPPKSNNAKV
jgi:phosphatidylglycerol---prolipoprotein diacylglyceryl transferase